MLLTYGGRMLAGGARSVGRFLKGSAKGVGVAGLGAIGGGAAGLAARGGGSGITMGDRGPLAAASGGAGFTAAATPMTSAEGATSVLSDADSSDPVVRQLQDVERVLVAIKGDTGQLVSGIGFNNNQPQAANQESLRSMFGDKGNSELGALGKGMAALGAGLLALTALPFLGDDEDDQVNNTGLNFGKFGNSKVPFLPPI